MILFEKIKNLKALFQTFSADDMMKLRPFINCTLLSENYLYIIRHYVFLIDTSLDALKIEQNRTI